MDFVTQKIHCIVLIEKLNFRKVLCKFDVGKIHISYFMSCLRVILFLSIERAELFLFIYFFNILFKKILNCPCGNISLFILFLFTLWLEYRDLTIFTNAV